MPDTLDADGLQTKSLNELITELEDGLKAIYGSDINVDSNSPDGQLINLFSQASIDLRELLTEIYNSMNPDNASGSILDERVTFNNIERKGGTFTIEPIDFTTTQTVTLQGLDADAVDPDGTGYTIQDNEGNEFILIDSATLVAGSYTKNFRAKNIGQVETTLGTIQTPVTIILGVTSIDNTTGPINIGQNEETDAQLRVRRQFSVAINSEGYLDGLLALLLNLDGVTEAKVFENITNAVDADGIEAHGIWAIVEGGANTDIADVIYSKKSYGANMTGAVTVDITTDSGDIFVAKFDRATAANLYIQFDIQKTVVGASFDQVAIKQYIEDNLTYDINASSETSRVTGIAVDAIDSTGGNGVPVNVEISDDGAAWVDYLPTATKDKQWVVDTSRITITVLP